jgi:hypothetical protein
VRGKLSSSKLSVNYALLHRIWSADWVPTNHTSTISTSLGKFIYVVGTKTDFDFGSYIFEETMKHAQFYAIKMPIAFPSLICGIILNQHPRILVSGDVVSKRESPTSLHYKLFVGTHIPDFVVTSGKKTLSTTSKEDIIEGLRAMFKTLVETIKTSTERKISVDKMILVLSAQDGDMVEENVNAAGNEDEDVSVNTDDEDGNADHEESEVEA